jgi:hypothetical protein
VRIDITIAAMIKAIKNVKNKCSTQLGMINKPNVLVDDKNGCFIENQTPKEICRTHNLRKIKVVNSRYVLNLIRMSLAWSCTRISKETKF